MNFCISSLYDEYYKESIGNIVLFLSSALSQVDGNLTPQCMSHHVYRSIFAYQHGARANTNNALVLSSLDEVFRPLFWNGLCAQKSHIELNLGNAIKIPSSVQNLRRG